MWERYKGRQHYYVYVTYKEVVVGHDYGTGMSDSAGACSHQDFLDGKFQGLIFERFGQDTLTEVIYAVNNTYKNPDHMEKRKEIARLKNYLDNIPPNPSLRNLINKGDTKNGFRNYGNAGGYKTIVFSDSCKIVYESSEGYIELDNGERYIFTLLGHGSACVALDNHFYVIDGDFNVISPKGKIVFSTFREDYKKRIFGSHLRIGNVFRYNDIIFFSYNWFNNDFSPGLIKYELNKGLVGQCDLEK
ncbi:MAG: hypothetical protein GF353_06840 [Candidatus Lokiarchaeota archaeon]|nr:hypothetical protein [Candidatus Lokiarchaeota archaeon]